METALLDETRLDPAVGTLVSVVMPARDEGDEVLATVESVIAGGAGEVIVVDDGSSDKSCDNLPHGAKILRNEQPMSSAFCRNRGGFAALGKVIVFTDAHIRVNAPGMLVSAAKLALERNAVICAGVQPLHGGGNWTGWGASLKLEKDFSGFTMAYDMKMDSGVKTVNGLIGACYVIPREIFHRIGGWVPTISWGYNEQALSMALGLCGVPILVSRNLVIKHKFKKSFNYKVSRSEANINRFIAHGLLFSHRTWRDEWLPCLSMAFRRDMEAGLARIRELNDVSTRFQSRKTVDDETFMKSVCGEDRYADMKKYAAGAKSKLTAFRSVTKKATAPPAVFVMFNGNGSSINRGRQICEGFRKAGFPATAVSAADFRRGPPSNSVAIFVKETDAELVSLAKARGNLLVHDVVDNRDIWRNGVPFAELHDAAVTPNKALAADWLSRGVAAPKVVGAVYHHGDARYAQANKLDSVKACYIGGVRDLPRFVWKLPDVDVITSWTGLFDVAKNYNLHVSIRIENSEQWRFKPNSKLASAVACGVNIVLTRDASNVEILNEHYPYYTDPDEKSVKKTLEYARATFGGPVWDLGLKMIAGLRDVISLDKIVESYKTLIFKAGSGSKMDVSAYGGELANG